MPLSKKIFLSLLMICCLSVSQIAFANTSSFIYSRSATAGEYKVEPTYNLAYSSSYSFVCGGDVGMYFYNNSVGLPGSYVKSSDRICYFIMYEQDTALFSTVRKYTGHFGTSNGYYRPITVSNTYTNSNKIEDDGSLEFNMEFKILKVSGDTSTAIPSQLVKYKYWTY